jgi:hypothetical protein
VTIESLIIASMIGVACALWARHEDRSGFGWFLFGTALSAVAVPILIVLTIQDRRRAARVAAEDAKEAEAWL